ncbi:MAG: right-handed parallel beta-helix repeat-containing protein [Candidatus Bathyarchaeales archaeon]
MKKKCFTLISLLVIILFLVGNIRFIDGYRAEFVTVPDDYRSIEEAINAVADGGTVFVKKGIYKEVLVINKPVSLKGEDKDTTVINGAGKGTVILIQHDNVEVTGFTVIYSETPNTPSPIWMWSSRLIGIHLLSVRNCSVFGNKISDCGAGIWLFDAHQNNITNNYLLRNDYGIRIQSSTENTVATNTITENWGGLWLLSASGNNFSANNMTNNTRNFGVAGDTLSAYLNSVDATNSVDGKPIYYWIGMSNVTVPLDAGCVVLVNCQNMTIQGLRLSKVQDAIVLANVFNALVANNSIINCATGIKLSNSIMVTITRNDINSAVGVESNGDGIQILHNTIKATSTGISVNGTYQTIIDNLVEAGTGGGGYKIITCNGSYNTITQNRLFGEEIKVGIVLGGSYNLFYENAITSPELTRVEGDANIVAKNTLTYGGISVDSGSNNSICANKIVNGFCLGIGGSNNQFYANHVENSSIGACIIGDVAHSSNNLIYQNNFVNNTKQVYNWGATTVNFWDNGTIGNYWSDYNGTDDNGDGIGDIPYFIRTQTFNASIGVVEVVCGQDNYPLIAPFDISRVNLELPVWEYKPPSPPIQPSQSPTTTPESTPTIEQQPENSSLMPIATVGSILAAISISVLIYVKKRCKR